ncbi:hypothetical protein M407DRAFT_25879 [Tulasnella calospora MUT 4182]|uniref:Transmembrane protein n=1 Tax=Tulasnella calospora MUT 4182 TaxID=1051891 RepID=A0A0C3QGP2_9AGAM|nr:hypothetical protein M407DRAFT_25879 [Tulasnella calospora MUT 4182]
MKLIIGSSSALPPVRLIAGLAFETYLSLFVFRVAISHIRAYGAGSQILYILIRDSLVWFVLLALCLLWNAVAWTAAPPGLSVMGIPALHASATIGGCRMLLNLRAAYFESLQPRDLDATSTAVSVLATDASIGRFRSLWTSSRREDTRRDQAASDDRDDRKTTDGRRSTRMESWTSLNDHVVRRASQAPPPPPLTFVATQRRQLSPHQVDFDSTEIELQDLTQRRHRRLDSLPGSSTDNSQNPPFQLPNRRGTQNEPASPLPPSWNWEAQLSTSSPPSPDVARSHGAS